MFHGYIYFLSLIYAFFIFISTLFAQSPRYMRERCRDRIIPCKTVNQPHGFNPMVICAPKTKTFLGFCKRKNSSFLIFSPLLHLGCSFLHLTKPVTIQTNSDFLASKICYTHSSVTFFLVSKKIFFCPCGFYLFKKNSLVLFHWVLGERRNRDLCQYHMVNTILVFYI